MCALCFSGLATNGREGGLNQRGEQEREDRTEERRHSHGETVLSVEGGKETPVGLHCCRKYYCNSMKKHTIQFYISLYGHYNYI